MALIDDPPAVEGPDLVVSRRLLADGIAAMDRGSLSEAVRLLHGALAALGLHVNPAPARAVLAPATHDPTRTALAARILLSLSFPHHELGDAAAALQAFDNAEALAADGEHNEIRVLIHGQRGAMFLREGRLAEAREELDVAATMLDFAPAVDQGKILINRGEMHGLLGNIGAARADCARALQLAEAYALPSLAFYARHNLGWFAFLSGDLPRALELMPMPDEGSSDFERGVVGADRAKVLLSAGLLSEADRSLAEACAALARTELVQFLAEAELTRAEVALLAERTALARSTSHAAVDRLRPRDNQRATALGELVQLQADAAAGVAAVELVRTADRLTRTFTRLGLADQARLARLIAIENPRRRDRPAGAARHQPRPAAGAAAARAAGPGPAGVRPRPPAGRAAARPDRAVRPDRVPDPVRQPGSADLQCGPRRPPGGRGHPRRDRGRPPHGGAGLGRAGAGGVRPRGRAAAAGRPGDGRADDPAALDGEPAGPRGGDRPGPGRAAETPAAPRTGHPRPVLDRPGTAEMAAEPRTADLRRALGDTALVTVFNLDEVAHAVVLTRRAAGFAHWCR